MPEAASYALFWRLTDPGELFAAGHIEDGLRSDRGSQCDETAVVICDFPCDVRVGTEWVHVQNLQNAVRVFRFDKRYKTTFVGDVEWIQTEEFACRAYRFRHGDRPLVEFYVNIGGSGDFIDGGGETAPCEITHTMDVDSGADHVENEIGERRAIADDV